MPLKFEKLTMRGSTPFALILVCFSSMGALYSLTLTPIARAQTAPAAKSFLGTITAAANGSLTVKTDAGVERKVTVPEGVGIKRVAPGDKNLNNAATIAFSDLSVGDRVLVKVAPEPTTDPVTAILIVAIPQADLAQKQEQEREDWQKNGVGGLVKSVNAGTGEVVIVTGAGPTEKTTTLHVTPATVLKRYAPDSVDYEKATKAPIETIQVGDQLRARGTKSADGTELAAAEVVSGSFRNISGTIASINATAMTLTLKDLLTKQTVTVHVGPEAQMRKLPDTMAKALAAMTKPQDNGAAPGSGQAGQRGQAGQGNRPTYGGAEGGQGRRSGDPQQMLSRAPAIHLADLQKGDAILLVSTQGTSEVTAVTLLAGVEPLLQAPTSTQNMLLSNWSMSSGSAEAAQ